MTAYEESRKIIKYIAHTYNPEFKQNTISKYVLKVLLTKGFDRKHLRLAKYFFCLHSCFLFFWRESLRTAIKSREMIFLAYDVFLIDCLIDFAPKWRIKCVNRISRN